MSILSGIDITSPTAQHKLRCTGAISGGTALLFAFVAFVTLYGRGLAATGILMLLCIGTAGVGAFGYTQPAFRRKKVFFGLMACVPPRIMIEPGWPLSAALLTVILAIYTIASA